MIVFPGSKINIGLFVTNKRPDNYHSLESIFVKIGWSDILEIVQDTNGEIGKVEFSSSGIDIPGESSSNLCVKAYELLHMDNELPATKIHLHKVVPIGAGLGGGSADGAQTLSTLNALYDLKINSNRLEELALQLGSDCPFFIRNTPQLVTGRGEIMRDIELNLTNHWIYLINPAIHISTKEAYSSIVPEERKIDIGTLNHGSLSSWKNSIFNDFEKPMKQKYPIIGEIITNLYATGAGYAAMTGSGSTVFGLFDKKPEPLKSYSHFEQWIGLI